MAVVAARGGLLRREAAQLLALAVHLDQRLPAVVLLRQPDEARQLVRARGVAGVLPAADAPHHCTKFDYLSPYKSHWLRSAAPRPKARE